MKEEEKNLSERKESLQHIRKMLQLLTDEQILFVDGFLRKYYFD